MNRAWNIIPFVLFSSAALCSGLSTSCLGQNDEGEDIQSQLLRFPDKGRKAVDPILTPGFLSMTFDDGPSQYTRNIVDILSRHNIQATFFCVGRLIAGQRETLDYSRQHEQQVASHSYNHEPQPALSEVVFKQRVSAVKINIGDRDRGRLFFRFPFGAADDDTLRWLSEVDVDGKHYRPVGWHTDSQDFDYDTLYPAEQFSKRILEDETVPDEGVCEGQANPFQRDFVGWSQFIARKSKGGIMLFHDTKRITSEKLEEVISGFEDGHRYWSTLPPDKQAEYGKYYACQKTDPFFRLEFQTLWGGAWPTLRD